MALQKNSFGVEREVSRPLADFPANIWDDCSAFFSFSDSDHAAIEAYKEKLSSLKEQVKAKLVASQANLIENIIFIDTLCRLGVSYHFEKEIEEQLEKIFGSHEFYDIIREDECDLYTVGLAFQVLRQFGFKLSSDVFVKFKDGDGIFKEHLGVDARAMLSMYEAAQWSIRGEDILDEALVFSKSRLEGLASRSSPHLAVRIKNALKYPYHKGIPRIEMRHYISYYEEDESCDETLLAFGKIDFNLLQLLHRKELAHVSRWYKDMNIESRVPCARNRMVESCMWAIGSHFEPQYSRSRIILAKTIILITILDDIYDAYGTLEELDLFTNALDRWLPEAPDALPDCMKHAYHLMVDFFDKVEKELEEEGRSGCGFHLKKAWKILGRSYYQEAKWLNEDYIPMFDEYKENGALTSTVCNVIAASFVGMVDVAKLDAFEWLSSCPKIILAAEFIWRFMDDIAGYEVDKKRKHVGTTIDCYMKQYGSSKDKATKEIHTIIAESWKDLNQGLMRPHSVPFPLLTPILNQTRNVEMCYKYHEGFTEPENMKDYVVSIFAENIPI